MIRKSLAAVFVVSFATHAGEWRYWTWPGQAKMATMTGRTAWFATSGGVFEWNIDANTSKLHQRSDGLPSTDIVSIASQKDGSVWAVSSDGHLAVKRPSTSTWDTKGTYSAKPSPWTFNPRVAAMHRNAKTGREVLVLGGPQGLTFFPADTGASLDWTDRFGSLGKREVRAVTLIDDTLWVGLYGGMARMVPPWDSLGNNRAFVSDPKRWTVLLSSDPADDYRALFYTSGGMTWQSAFSWGGRSTLVSASVTWWNGVGYTDRPIPDAYGLTAISAVHALDIGDALLVSSTDTSFAAFSKGPFLVTKNGTVKDPPYPSNSLPSPPPPAIHLGSGMHLTVWSTNRVLSWSRNAPRWISPWIGDFSSASGVNVSSNFDLVDPNIDMNTFAQTTNGSIWVGSWGRGVWSALRTDSTGDSLVWKNWTNDNSCLEGANNSNLASYVVINSIMASDSAVWGATHISSGDSAVLFSARLDGSDIRCWHFPATGGVPNSGLHLTSNRLWLATHQILRSYRVPQSSSSRLVPVSSFSDEFHQVTTLEHDDQAYVLASTPSALYLLKSLENKDSIVLVSTKQSSPLTARQQWKKMAIDGLGQIWLAGAEGIDILALQDGTDGLEFKQVRKITTDDGLPSDFVYNLSIDAASGMALVATDRGIGLWSSPYRPLIHKLDSKRARVYPNPLRTRTNSELVVDGASTDAHFFLHAADGSLVVHLSPSDQSGGYFRWKIPSPDQLRPGVYRWTLKDGNSKVGGPLLIAE